MAAKFLKHRWQKITLIVLLSFLGVILLLAFLINQYWSPILSDKVKSAVASSSDSLYKVSFSDAKLHVIKGEIVIYNIVLKPDTAVYNKKKLAHLAPNNLIELHVKRIVLSHIHPFRLYFKHQLEIGNIILSQPEIMVSYRLNHTKDTVTEDNRTPWQKISKSLRSIHVGSIMLNDVKFKYHDYSGHKLAISELKEMNLSATDLLIDSASQTDKSRLLYCRDIVTELNNYSGKTPNGLYVYKIKSLRLSTRSSKLNVNGLYLKPVKPSVFFNKSSHDRFAIHLDSIQLNHFDFLSYHKYRTFNASSLIIDRGAITIFANPKPSTDKSDKIKTFPHFALQQIKDDFNLDTVHLKHINITYNEYNTQSKKIGTITFNNSSARILNISTNKTTLQKNNICTAQVTTYLMNRGRLNVLFKLNLTDKDAAYTYKGTLGKMDLRLANQATMPLALVKFSSGNINEISFDIQSNRTVSKGRVTVLYNDLVVKLLKADTANKELEHKTLASLFANAVVIKHNNPDNQGDVPRSANVVLNRPPESPFFKNMWKTILSGIKPCVGLSDKVQQTVNTKISQQETKKQQRELKKAARKQRRAERKKKRELKKAEKAREKELKKEQKELKKQLAAS